MKPQTIAEMLAAGATETEATAAYNLFDFLRPALKIKRDNGRIDTSEGDKTVLGLYRSIADKIMNAS